MKRKIRKWYLYGISGFLALTGLFLSPRLSGEALAEEEEIPRVLLPTGTEHTFDFIMDPQELISRTDAAAYGGLSFEEGATLFFRRHEEGAGKAYSSLSDELVITNLGTADVEVEITAGVSPDSLGPITMTDDKTFAGDTEASLYLALTDGEHTLPIDVENTAVIRTMLAGADGENETGGEYRFRLVGAVNRNGDWSETGNANPRVTVTWKVMPGEEEPEEEQTLTEEETLPETEETLTETETSETEETSTETEEPETKENPGETEAAETKETPTETESSETKETPTQTEPSETESDPIQTAPSETKENPGETETAETEGSETAGENPKETEPTKTEEKPAEKEETSEKTEMRESEEKPLEAESP